ncbi:hypothetical protein BU26DRAFT_609274 [Trematosphaeria pertusa]|uniref:Uncharacterized protein n=1 Tax=Trematosphaeria pertusa TaxID=390896 RepID=A0A6A6HY83_9PLEO|nr:uncharacterized protein BU26DRAFT_609274 [Trematosphaeria pertusa]KAF2243184.1 hypothetical protein BU26DRAFT_609274 [Trematosphaeria pertusa]
MPEKAPDMEQRAAKSSRSAEDPPSYSLFTVKSKATRATWHLPAGDEQKYIQVAVEREGMPNGVTVCEKVEPHLLFNQSRGAPGLRKYLIGRRILLPAFPAIDEDVVYDVVQAILQGAKEDRSPVLPLATKPVQMIKLHCVLALFEMERGTNKLSAELWRLFGERELEAQEVFWIWETFKAASALEGCKPPYLRHAGDYVQMVAWQILNLDAEGRLNNNVRYYIQMENGSRQLTNVLKERFDKYGLSRDTEPKTSAISTTQSPAKEKLASTTRQAPGVWKQATQKQTQASQKPSLALREAQALQASGGPSISFMKSVEVSMTKSAPPLGQPEPRGNAWGTAVFGSTPAPTQTSPFATSTTPSQSPFTPNQPAAFRADARPAPSGFNFSSPALQSPAPAASFSSVPGTAAQSFASFGSPTVTAPSTPPSSFSTGGGASPFGNPFGNPSGNPFGSPTNSGSPGNMFGFQGSAAGPTSGAPVGMRRNIRPAQGTKGRKK